MRNKLIQASNPNDTIALDTDYDSFKDTYLTKSKVCDTTGFNLNQEKLEKLEKKEDSLQTKVDPQTHHPKSPLLNPIDFWEEPVPYQSTGFTQSPASRILGLAAIDSILADLQEATLRMKARK